MIRIGLLTFTAISLVCTGCATSGAMTQIAKQTAKKAAIDTAKQKTVETVASAITEEEKDNTEGTIVKQSSTEVIAPTAKKEDTGFFNVRRDVPEVKVTYGKTKNLANIEEFVVPFYRINYLKSSNYKNSSNNSYTKASARVLSTLEGVSDNIFAGMTEEAYADFKDKMMAAGFKVRAHGDLSTVQKYLAKSKYPRAEEDAYRSVPEGATYAGGKYSNAELKVEMGDKVNVMSVDLDANFVINNRNEKKFNITQAKETVRTSQGANVGGKVVIRIRRKQISLEIGQPPYSQIAFGTMEDATKGGDKAGDAAKMAAGMLFGRGQLTRSTTKRKIVKADEAKYRQAMMDALKQANALIVEKLASSKTSS